MLNQITDLRDFLISKEIRPFPGFSHFLAQVDRQRSCDSDFVRLVEDRTRLLITIRANDDTTVQERIGHDHPEKLSHDQITALWFLMYSSPEQWFVSCPCYLATIEPAYGGYGIVKMTRKEIAFATPGFSIKSYLASGALLTWLQVQQDEHPEAEDLYPLLPALKNISRDPLMRNVVLA